MEKNFYPTFEEFKEEIKSGSIMLSESEAADISSIPKLIDQGEVISPYTGKKINVKKVADEIEKAKFKITTQSPLYRPYVHEMTPTIYTWVIQTMATDGVRLFVNPEFAAELSWLGKIFVIIHEIMHCIYMHQERGKGFDHQLFNIAADYEINTIIVDTTDDFDENFVKNEIKGLYDKKYLNKPVEEIYRDLEKNPPQTPPPPPNAGQGPPQFGGQQGQGQPGQGQPGEGQPGQGQPGQGQGGSAGDKSDDAKNQQAAAAAQSSMAKKLKDIDKGRAGGVIDTKTGEQIAAASGYDPEEARQGEESRAKWEANAKEILKAAEKLKEAGNVRGDALINSLKKFLKGSQNWKQLLKAYVGNALMPEKEYRVGSKKHLYKSREYLKRGLKKKKSGIKKAVVAVDVSGSMFYGDTFEKVMGEVNDIIFAKKIKEITILFFDTHVDPGSVQKVKANQNVWKPKNIKGGGGTAFQPIFDWIKTHMNDYVNLCIVLTDGYASPPKTPPYHNKVIWLIYDNFDWDRPFGRVIRVATSDM